MSTAIDQAPIPVDTKLPPNQRNTKKMTEILTRQSGVLTAY
jgi:hypothetical protein